MSKKKITSTGGSIMKTLKDIFLSLESLQKRMDVIEKKVEETKK